MTERRSLRLSEAVELMKNQIAKHGDVEVWFDCPFCGRSFAPNRLVAAAVHLTEQAERGRKEPSDE